MLGALWRRLPGSVRDKLSDWIIVNAHFRGPRIASRFRQRVAKIRNPRADVTFGPRCYLGPGFSLRAPWGGHFHAAEGCEFRRGFQVELAGPESEVVIGPYSIFTNNALVQCGRSIRVGTRTAIGQSAQLVDGKHRFRDLDTPAKDQGYDLRPLSIGDDVMILSKCTIVSDVGDRVVVGANSVVTKPVPAFSVAVGAPARVVDSFGSGD